MTREDSPAWEDLDVEAAVQVLANDIHALMEAKGFYNNLPPTPAMALAMKSQQIMLVVTELAELVEGLRKPVESSCHGITNEEEEVADAIIRLLDYSGAHSLRIGYAIRLKMLKNEGRPFRHGKAF